MSSPLPINFLQSAARLNQLPDRVLELAFIGRSNVGKSSLINALANRKKLAKISKTPGATQLINVYELNPEGSGNWLVDLPGYGYAKAPKQEMDRWRRMIEEYLIESPSLGGVYVLIDGVVGPTALDLQTIEWLEHIDLSYRFVATKVDKIRPSKSQGRRKDLVNKLGVEKKDVMWVSASTGSGIPQLRSEILDYFA
ncbi:MAG: ribosome biogenesis GTP-binding protein YihA/YsxC [Acidimicrobiales bacterium]|jgi:GTP-binding protein|nr:ribosome biogenesis GTP-binding protein YihA/YsxC [Acidimicrobiales bacterium]MDP6298576.1 ribosome biogenesis GTP-binding protein YihA/YsxC [Acidimicrobiales bacterium]HJM29115.1 ribosome biogenesis GTP-binding protein YihA/YsxC [Acidimicrobiales bacterium]HJM97431.1 ribosome biogenesis GTP-binding protein YihA/YsxC [Acidimicrobiales bacterium]